MVDRNRVRRLVFGVFSGAVLLAACPTLAADLIVEVSAIRSDAGEIGCALFADSAGFPREPSRAMQQRWQPAKASTMTCQFEGVKPGNYAVAVTHDLNGNHRTDANFLGIPTEDWGVSKNVRPSLRAPRFDEAVFAATDASPTTIAVRLAH